MWQWYICFGLIYVGFLSLAAFFPDFWGVTLLRYTGVALAFVYAYKKFVRDYLLQLALAITLLADTILIIDNVSLVGVLIFCVAQMTHTMRFLQIRTQDIWWYGVSAIIVAVLVFFGVLPPIVGAASFYGVTLGTNFYLALRWYKKKPCVGSWCAKFGFLLFICCDVCVAGSYFSLTGVLPATIYVFANYFAWMFYFPAQILIANSSKLNKSVIQ